MSGSRAENIKKAEEVMDLILANPDYPDYNSTCDTDYASCHAMFDFDPELLEYHIAINKNNPDTYGIGYDYYVFFIVRNRVTIKTFFGSHSECYEARNLFFQTLEAEREVERKRKFEENKKILDEKIAASEREREQLQLARWEAAIAASKDAADKIELPVVDNSSASGEHVIYVLTCKPTGRQYVGRTNRSAEMRFKEHCTSAVKNKMGSSYMLNDAIRKYGANSFDIKVLYNNLSFEQAVEYEALVIKKYQTLCYGLNVSPGGFEEINAGVKKNNVNKFNKEHKDLMNALGIQVALLFVTHKQVMQSVKEILVKANEPWYERKHYWDFAEVQELMDKDLIAKWNAIKTKENEDKTI